MTFVFQIYAHSFVAAFVGLLLTFQFMQLFVIVGQPGGERGRRAAVHVRPAGRSLAVVALVLAIAWQAGWTPGQGGVGEGLARPFNTDVWRTVSQPLSYFFDAFLSEKLWPDLAWNALLALLVDLVLLGVVFGMDAQYLEASVSASAGFTPELQRMRRVGLSGGARRQGALQSADGAVVGRRRSDLLAADDDRVARGRPAAAGDGDFHLALTARVDRPHGQDSRNGCVRGLISFGGPMMALLTMLAPFDFRGDVDQMALLEDAADAGVAAGPGRGSDAGADLHADPVDGPGRGGMVRRPTRPVAAGRRRVRPVCTISSFSGWIICYFWCSRRGSWRRRRETCKRWAATCWRSSPR